jgi:phosphoribosylaminoimidazole-succinocarboxamide synthase
LFKKGKVRDIYLLDDQLLLVATDRISAFDLILPTEIPDKGKILTSLSEYWFHAMEDIVPHPVHRRTASTSNTSAII